MLLSSPSAFAFVQPLPLEPRHYNNAHLFAGAASELFIDARSAYLRAVGWPGLGPAFWLIIRHLAIDYVTEAFAGEELWCGVRVTSRSRRTVHVESSIWERETQRIVLEGRIADVAFDVGARRSVDVPDELWEYVARFEGRPLSYVADIAGEPLQPDGGARDGHR